MILLLSHAILVYELHRKVKKAKGEAMTDYKDNYEYKILTNDTVKLTTAIEGVSIGTEGVVTKIVEPGISYFEAFPTIFTV